MSRSAADGANATVQIIPPSRARPAEAPRQRDRSETGDRLLLTVAEAARRLGIGRSLLYELLADGHIESIHVGRLRRIPADALVTYIDRQRKSQLPA